MKILHTSDWHLGHVLHDHSRTEEQTCMLEQMASIVGQEQPDALVLSGDIFHTGQPSSAAQKMYAEALVAIHRACPTMVIVCTAGNHDSASMHEIFRSPWLSMNVHSIGLLNKVCPESHIVRLAGKGYIIALPYCYERNMPDGFVQGLLDNVAAENTSHLPVVMMAHTTLENADLTGHATGGNTPVGGIDTMSIGQLGHGYDYLALGHIHHAQWVKGSDHRARYSGAPLPVSFDETYEHSVSIVTMHKHGDAPQLRVIPINNPHPLVNLPTQGYVGWEDGKRLLQQFPQDIPARLRLNIVDDGHVPSDALNEAETLVQDKACILCLVNKRSPEGTDSNTASMSVEEFKEVSPLTIARQYAHRKQLVFDSDMEELFNQAINSINQE